MKKEIPFIHLFRTPANYYIYDVNSDALINIDCDTYMYLKDGQCSSELNSEKANDTIKRMRSDGLLSTSRVSEIIHPETEALAYYLENKINMITLQVTQNCNLRCSYCAYSGGYENRHHNNKIMDIETAKQGIDFLIKHSSENQQVNIGFYGGEPLLMFDLIKECVDYAESSAEGKDLTFNLTTNGTLITDEILEYFVMHSISIMLSLDGPIEIHDKNRRTADGNNGSFEMMINNVEMIKKKYPNYFIEHVSFNTVIDPANDFSCVNNFIADSSLLSDASFSSSLISDIYAKSPVKLTENFTVEKNYELFKVLLSKLGRLDRTHVSKLLLAQYDITRRYRSGKQNRFLGSLPEKAHHGGPCLPGVLRLFINADGSFYPCERVSEASETMKIGDLDNGIDIEKAKKLLNMGSISEQACKNCWAFYYCTLCAASADNLQELSYDVLRPHCLQVKSAIEYIMKDYCVLREFGHDFQEEQYYG